MEAKRFVQLCLLAVCLVSVAACGETSDSPRDKPDDGGASGGTGNGSNDGNNGNGDANNGATNSPDGGEPGADSGSDAEMPPIDARRQKVVSVAPPYGVAGEPYGYPPKSDQANETVWSVKSGPSGMSVDQKSQSIAWTPTQSQGGKHEVEIEGQSSDKAVTQTYEMYVAVPEKQATASANPKAESVVAVTSPKSELQGTAVYTAPGAVKEPVEISISKVDEAPPMRAAKGDVTAVQFGPSGTVFQQPALVALPLSGEVEPDFARVGAFVYNPAGSWERVPVIRVDLANRLVYARANHFSTYAAAESAFVLDTSLATMPSLTACEGDVIARAALVGALAELRSDVVNNLPAELRALVRGGVTELTKLLVEPQIEGSFRFSRALTLWSGPASAREKVEEQLLVTTLYLPGDGSARITHSDALGNEIASFQVASLVNSFADVEPHLRGEHSHALFRAAPSGLLSLSASMHVAFYEGDASVDAASSDDLGLALVDAPLDTPAALAVATDVDTDCDGLQNAVDALDNRQLARFEASPNTVASSVVGAPVRLSVALRNAPENTQVSFEVLAGAATLSAVDGQPYARELLALKPGRYLVEARADVSGTALSHVFAVDVALAGTVPACALTLSSTQVKVGESVTLSAALDGSAAPSSALTLEWGTISEGAFTTFEGPDAATTTTFSPASAGTLILGCRASDGVTTGASGVASLDVLGANQNRAPRDLILSPPSTTLVVGQSAALVASASDPDGEALTFTWSASAGTLGTPSSNAQGSTNTFQAATPGLYEVTVGVRDAQGPEVLLRASVLVVSDRTVLDAADADGDGWPVGTGLDCDDGNAKTYPGAVDACGDEVDDDCDGTARKSDCDDDGFSAQQGDCNDQDARIGPQAFEYCDGVDNDCDEAVDERELDPVGATCSRGAGTCATAGVFVCANDALNTVCNAPSVAPSKELCNGLDDNCDGVTPLEEIDNDGDGLAECAGDCDDTRENVRAGRSDGCDAIDNDCDGKTDEDHVAEATNCGIGVCASQGALTCLVGKLVDSCTEKQATGLDDDCDGVDDDCDGETDESFATDVTCGVGVCQTSGEATCVDGRVTTFCTPDQGAPNDSACNGQDDDCDGKTDEDAVTFPFDVCNGVDDDCNGELDPISCEGGEVDPNCVPINETCNMRDDDCDGRVDDENVCGIALSPGSLLGAWWRCLDATCQTLSPRGLFFTSQPAPVDAFRAFGLSSLDEEPYVPADGPYCGDSPLAYIHNQATGALSVQWDDEGGPGEAVGQVTFAAQRATIHWTQPPPGEGSVFELVRIPEQSLGSCAPVECATFESCGNQTDDNCDGLVDNGCPGVCFSKEICDNGIDDDCDKAGDMADPDCGGGCAPSGDHFEQCNGQDDDCDGLIDELNAPCELPNLSGVCALGQLFCGPGGQGAVCQQVTQPSTEYCDDARDTDCDGVGENDGVGSENDEPSCSSLAAGEACFNAIDISGGGTFAVSFDGALPNEVHGCGPHDAADRVFTFTLPPSPFSTSVFFNLKTAQVLHEFPVTVSILHGSCQDSQPECFDSFAGGSYSTHLMAGTYFVVVRGQASTSGVSLSVGFSGNGCDGACSCVPGDVDGDESTICDGDCHEGNDQIGPYETELCNGLDDDCNGQVDDLTGACTTQALGTCNFGRTSCVTGQPACTPVYSPGVEYCGDAVDSDCDGDASSGETDCDQTNVAAETCFGATSIGLGGTFSGSLEFANDDLTLPTCRSGDGPEHVYAFDVPGGYDYKDVTVRRVAGVGRLDFAIVRDCESLTVERCLGASGMATLSDSGTHYLIVEGDPGPYAFTLGVAGDHECLTPDADEDGYTACYEDCDESDAATHMDANESTTCDGVDNDCNGLVDDVFAPCDMQMLLGECRKGLLDCEAGCQQRTYSQDSVEVCNDGIDNDCDGHGDDEGLPGVDCTTSSLPGETCGSAIDVSAGGRFQGSLASALDNVELDCGASNAPDQFFRVDLLERRQLFTRVAPHPESLPGPGGHTMVSVSVLDESCSNAGQVACLSNNRYGHVFDAGTYFIVVEGPAGLTFDLTVWSRLENGGPETCIPGDLDEDGQNACAGDCGEGDETVYGERFSCEGTECGYLPGAQELCDGKDNDCNSIADDIFVEGPCLVPEAQGTCALGVPTCEQGTEVCVSNVEPGPERCNDGLDTDCDGLGESLPDEEIGCKPAPPGDMCTNAIDISAGGFFQSSLNGMAPDGFDCSSQGMVDRYFVYTPAQTGFLFVDAKALGQQPTSIATRVTQGCTGSEACFFPDVSGVPVTASQPYYLSVGAAAAVDFQLRVALYVVDTQAACLASGVQNGDFDADGVNLCNEDCDESNPNVYPGQFELCNGMDDDCNGSVDDVSGAECMVPGQLGECAHGYVFGCNGNEVECGQVYGPQQEYCNDGLDTDCDGSKATNEPECIVPQ